MLGYLVAHHHRWIALKALKAVIEIDWPHYAQYFVSTLLSTISNWGEKTNRPTCLESKSWFALSLFWICLIRLGCVNCRFQLTSKILYSRSLDQTKSCLYTNSFFWGLYHREAQIWYESKFYRKRKMAPYFYLCFMLKVLNSKK